MRRRTSSAGTALVEAIVVAPTFALVLGAALALHSMYSAKLTAKERARRLAWLQADSGECPASSCSTAECDSALREVEGAFGAAEVSANGLSLNRFLDRARDFFVGKTTRGVASAESKVPAAIVRNGVTKQSGATEIVCNTRARQTSAGESVLDHACRTDLRTTEYAREVCR